MTVADKAQPHLRDLFRIGEEVSLKVPQPDGTIASVSIWMRVPTTDNQQEAIRKAGAKQARLRQALKDKDSDDYAALMADMDQIEARDDMEEFLLSTEDSDLREKAYNEVLYGEFGSNWEAEDKKTGEPGLDYLNVLQATFDRSEELKAEGLPLEEDPEMARLQAVYDQFQAEVDDRLGELRRAESLKLKNRSDEELRAEIWKKMVDLLSRTAWLEEYSTWLTFFACRNPNDRKKFYFRDPGEIAELPEYVQAQIRDKYREISRIGGDLKVSSTPENSSDSSGQSGEPAVDSSPSSQTE
jgi:hypothetical protein